MHPDPINLMLGQAMIRHLQIYYPVITWCNIFQFFFLFTYGYRFISATTSFALAIIKLRWIFYYFFFCKLKQPQIKKNNLIIYILTSPLTDRRIFTESTSVFLIPNLVIKKNICFISLLFAFHLDALKSEVQNQFSFPQKPLLSLCEYHFSSCRLPLPSSEE